MAETKQQMKGEAWLNEIISTTVRLPRRMAYALQRAADRKGISNSAFVIVELTPTLKPDMEKVDVEYKK